MFLKINNLKTSNFIKLMSLVLSRIISLPLMRLIIIISFVPLFTTSIILAQKAPTNINEISDLFNKEIEGKDNLNKFIENSKNQASSGIENREGLKVLPTSDSEAENKTSELNSINANSLESKGNEERGREEHNYYDSLEVDYSDPKIINHTKDLDKIREASEKLMSRLIEGLKELDIDCKQAKGNKEIEPEYYIDIEKEHLKDTIYNKHLCEELRNQYNCGDEVTLKCKKTGVKYGEWQDRVMYLGGFELWNNYHGWAYTIKWKSGRWGVHMAQTSCWPNVDIERKNLIINRLAVKPEQVEGGNAPMRGEGSISHVEGEHFVFEKYPIYYKYRDAGPICEVWSEDWAEKCTLR